MVLPALYCIKTWYGLDSGMMDLVLRRCRFSVEWFSVFRLSWNSSGFFSTGICFPIFLISTIFFISTKLSSLGGAMQAHSEYLQISSLEWSRAGPFWTLSWSDYLIILLVLFQSWFCYGLNYFILSFFFFSQYCVSVLQEILLLGCWRECTNCRSLCLVQFCRAAASGSYF